MIRLHQILLPVLMLPGSAIAGCDTDLFASSTCGQPSLWPDVDQPRDQPRDQPPVSTGLVAAAAEVAGPPAANDAALGGEGPRRTVGESASED